MSTVYGEGGGTTQTRGRVVTWRRVLLALAVAVVAVVAGGVIWLASYAPLGAEPGVWGYGPATLRPTTVDPADGSDGLPVYFVSQAETGTVSAGVDVGNTGRLPIRVEGLAEDDASHLAQFSTGFWMGETLSGEGPNHTYYGDEVKFEPFTLKPGETRFLSVQVGVAGIRSCSRPVGNTGSDLIVRGFHVRYSYLGGVVHRTAWIELPFRLNLVCGKRPPAWPPGQ